MGNIKVGKFVDEDGESLNDVETVLGELGIRLRESNDEFRNFSDVLDEVAQKWDSFTETEKNAAATALGGTKQREKLLILMSNYGAALDYASIAAESAGTATKKYEAYTDGVAGSVQELKAAFEELSLALLDSDLVADVMGLGTGFLDLATGAAELVDNLGGLKLVATVLAGIFALKISNNKTKIGAMFSDILSGVKPIMEALKAGGKDHVSLLGVIKNLWFQVTTQISSATLAIGGLTAGLAAAIAILSAIDSSQKQKIADALDNASAHREASQAAYDEAKALTELIQQYEELAKAKGIEWTSSQLETIKGIQDDITELVGDQADNIDLVNGKLRDQKRILTEVRREKLEEYEQEATVTRAAAIRAYDAQVSNQYWFGERYQISTQKRVNDLFDDLASKYHVKTLEDESGGITGGFHEIAFNFEDIDDFVQQYENVESLISYLSKDDLFKESKAHTKIYDVALKYVKDYQEFYDSYTTAVDDLESVRKRIAELEEYEAESAVGKSVEYKGWLKTLEEIAPAYNAISEALADLGESRLLNADALSSLLELEENGKIGGVETAKLITETAEGYKLAADALEQYVEALVNTAILEAKVDHASEESRQNAIRNLETLVAVLATLSSVQEDAYDPSISLEAEKDALDERLDKYKELIDLRKDLIETYVDELEYQRELEKKQQKVSSLQTKLAVARLDNSAAGQARVRELESQLQEAQEDLEDFTLEHAIEEILGGLDNQYSEYENFIKAELEKIGAKLDALKNPDSAKIAGLDMYLSQLQDAIIELNKPVELTLDRMFEQWQAAYYEAVWGTGGDPDNQKLYEKAWEDISNLWNLGNKSRAKFVLDQLLNGKYAPDYAETNEEDEAFDAPIINDEQIGLLGTEIGQKIADAVNAWLNRDSSVDTTETPNVAETLDARTITRNVHSEMNSVASEDRKLTGGRNAVGIQNYYMGTLDNILEMMSKSPTRAMQMYEDLMKNKFSIYHDGGFVGGYAGLRENEEFAKLMKTEFVSTPTQIRRFMTRTLPQIASIGGTNPSQEFNAPLIEINCESVTSESMPQLKQIVNEAVSEIKKCLDDGMSRTGYKRTVKKLLT